MAFDRKPIELEAGWKFMEVGNLAPRTVYHGRRERKTHARPRAEQEGITKLKAILEGDPTEVGRSRPSRLSVAPCRLPRPPPTAASHAAPAAPLLQNFTAEHYMMLCE